MNYPSLRLPNLARMDFETRVASSLLLNCASLFGYSSLSECFYSLLPPSYDAYQCVKVRLKDSLSSITYHFLHLETTSL
jgi:hypothetical protein